MKSEKQKALINLRKTRGLLDKIIQMAERDEYCIDIMQQNLAAIGLLKSVNQTLMENHLYNCFSSAMNSNNDDRKNMMINEILTISKLSQR